jgi:hypothetical protein
MRKAATIAALALLGLAAPAAGQAAIHAGMSADEVRAAFGAPARTRDQGDWTYWFYPNGCPVRCGSDDVVFLQDGKVVAAVLRTPRRRFEGPTASAALASVEGMPPERGLVRLPAARHRVRSARRPSAVMARRAPAAAAPSRRTGANRPAAQGGRIVIRGAPARVGGVTVDGDARQGSAAVGIPRQGAPAAPANGRTVITGQPGTLVGTGGAGASGGAAPAGVARRGSRAVGDSTGLQTRTSSDSSTDQARLDREKRVTPRVVPAPPSGIHP